MAFLPLYNYYILNGELNPVAEFVPAENDGGIYEVVRVERGVPLFIGEHLQRFFSSVKMARKISLYSKFEIIAFVKKLIAKNGVEAGNILISCRESLKIFFVAHRYPTEKMVEEGVVCGVLNAERVNPNAKVLQTSVRQKADKLISENNYYEVLLVDNSGRITEGSRSNVFFVKGNEIITSPGNNVLLGVTRKNAILLAQEAGYFFFEEEIEFEKLSDFDAVFITGTSPKILPVKQVDNFLFDPQNKIVRFLIDGYNQLIDEYIKRYLPN